MMKIAFISNNIPLPEERNGNTVNIINIIRELKKRNYTIDFYLFSEDLGRDYSFIKEFKNEVDSLICRRHVSKYAFWVNFFRKKIKLDCPAFYCNFNTGYYYPLFKSDFSILYAADSVAYQYSKQKGLEAKLRYFKLQIEEKFLYKRFDKTIFVSPQDLEFAKIPDNRGVYIPIGYRLDNSLSKDVIIKEYDLVFSGNYDYPPNMDAFLFFCMSIYPLIIEKYPKIRICFVGRNPSKEMIDFANEHKENIIVTGEVDSIFPFLYRSKIYFSPLRKGSGMKNKILQAMIAKLPIVCTSESITGINEYDINSVFVSDTPEGIANHIIRLLSISMLELKNLGDQNYYTFINSYTWDSVVNNYYTPLLKEK